MADFTFSGPGLILAVGSACAITGGVAAALRSAVGRALRSRREKAFSLHFADTVGSIAGDLRRGVALSDCLSGVSRNAPDPVARHFRTIVDDTAAGYSLSEAMIRASSRMPTRDFGFFAAAVRVQATTGGNLAEIMGNISGVLRGRRALSLSGAAA